MTTVTHDKHWKEVWDALDEDGKEAYLKERDIPSQQFSTLTREAVTYPLKPTY